MAVRLHEMDEERCAFMRKITFDGAMLTLVVGLVRILVEEIKRLQALSAERRAELADTLDRLDRVRIERDNERNRADELFNTREWQPIETAPKTGKPILMYCHIHQHTYCVKWDKYESRWMIFGCGGSGFLDQEPTCWQPQPANPLPIATPKEITLTEAQHREQCISFAYGNTHLSNPSITRKMVEEMYDKWHPRDSDTPADVMPEVSDTNKLEKKGIA